MKKAILINIIFLGSLAFTYGQLPVKEDFFKQDINIIIPKSNSNFNKTASAKPQASWLNFSEALIEEFSSGKFWPMILWPDSTVVITSTQSKRYYDVHGFVSILDPVSTFFSNYVEKQQNLDNATLWYNKYKRFDIDSVRIYFNYSNPNKTVDTLKVYFILPGSSALVNSYIDDYPFTGDKMRVMLVNYDHIKNKPTGTNIIEQTILLTEQDTLSLPNFKELVIPVNISIPPDAQDIMNKVGIAFVFVPGHSYNLNDTLIDQSDNPVEITNKLNLFRLLTYEENYQHGISGFPFSYYDETLNQSGVASKSVRYNINLYGWNGKYLNTFAFQNEFAYEHAYIDWFIKPIGNIFTYDTLICTNRSITYTENSNFNANQWLWDFGDGNTSSDKDPVHTFTGPGNFTISLLSWNDTDTFSYSKIVNVNWCSNVTDPLTDKLNIYPNPVSEVLHIKKGSTHLDRIVIRNINGRRVDHIAHIESSSDKFIISVNKLIPGFYTIEGYFEKGVFFNSFIKM